MGIWLRAREEFADNRYISVKMAAPWGSLTLLCFHSLCLPLRSHLTKWEVFQNTFHSRLLFTRLEIVFITISPFTKRTKAVPKVFQKGECYLVGSIDLACGLQLQMLPRLNGHFINVLVWFCT